MKILLLLSESWNDKIAPNNNMTNWFSGFPNAEIWTISGSSTTPCNHCCKDYFMINEMQMLKSVVTRKKVGKVIHLEEYPCAENSEIQVSENKQVKAAVGCETTRFVRDLAWRYGRYNIEMLRKFIEDFQPDVIFSQRKGSVKMCRLEYIVMQMTKAPMVVYTGDDDYSLQQCSFSPMFWIRRFWTRRWINKVAPNYKLLYSQSKRQMDEFSNTFHIPTKFLVKCGEFNPDKLHTTVGAPIRLVYVGKLYCNRWKTLAMLAEEIRTINSKRSKQCIHLDIYTADAVSKKQHEALNDGLNSAICGSIPASQIPELYSKSDIVLHVEGMDKRNRLATKDSFSTKVMDCMASGCAVMVISWDQHAAYKYLKEQDAAMVAHNSAEIGNLLANIADNPKIITEYACKALSCGEKFHQREYIQNMISGDFIRAKN